MSPSECHLRGSKEEEARRTSAGRRERKSRRRELEQGNREGCVGRRENA